MGAKALDITGHKYGRLIAISNTGRKCLRNYIWKFRCDCGKEVEIASGEVRRGKTVSCGCYRKEISSIHAKKIQSIGAKTNEKHLMSKTPTFVSWDSMKQRCLNDRHKSYKDYGGRGIKVCPEWINSFESFLSDMGARPKNSTLDRINTNGNYESTNCRWASGEEQANNKRSSKLIEFEGKLQTSVQWAREYGLCSKVLLYRLKNNWEIKKALMTKVNYGNNKKRRVALS